MSQQQILIRKRGAVLRTLAGLRAQLGKLEAAIHEAEGTLNESSSGLTPDIMKTIKSLIVFTDDRLRREWNMKPLDKSYSQNRNSVDEECENESNS